MLGRGTPPGPGDLARTGGQPAAAGGPVSTRAPAADTGLARLRSQVPRSFDGPEHTRRRVATDRVVATVTVIPN